MKSNKISIGDTIGLISPSHIASPDRYIPIASALEKLGFKLKMGKNLYCNTYLRLLCY